MNHKEEAKRSVEKFKNLPLIISSFTDNERNVVAENCAKLHFQMKIDEFEGDIYNNNMEIEMSDGSTGSAHVNTFARNKISDYKQIIQEIEKM